MAQIPFPRSSTPGRLPGEGEGRLINVRAATNGDTPYLTRVPGLVGLGSGSGQVLPRGLFAYVSVPGSALLAAYSNVIRQFDIYGNVYVYSGSLPGTDMVTMAQNIRSPLPDVVAVRQSGGAYHIPIGGNAVNAYPDPDLPATVNSVSSLSSYFLFTDPNTGRIWASGLGNTSIDGLSFASAESHPDLLIRGISVGNTFYAFGTESIEPWLNLGRSPFPLVRQQTVIPVGLLEFGAVAGAQEGWDREMIFVAPNGTVISLDGYTPRPISTPPVERFIADSTAGTFEANVYAVEGQSYWSLTTSAGTWEYNLATGSWHERVSTGLSTWRASRTAKVYGSWFALDRLSDKLLKITTVATENGAVMPVTLESGDLKGFPEWAKIPALFLEFTRGQGSINVSWSKNGGATWSTPEAISLTDLEGPARLNNLGTASPLGLRVRLTTNGTFPFSFLSANVPDLAAVPG
jgi:hypothetical protein